MGPGLRSDCGHLGQTIGKLIFCFCTRSAATACIETVVNTIWGRAFSTLLEAIRAILPESAILVLVMPVFEGALPFTHLAYCQDFLINGCI